MRHGHVFLWLNLQSKAALRPHFSWEICKHSFICTVKSTVYTNPSQKRSFRKHSSDRRNSKTPASSFSVNAKHFERAFQKRWRHHSHVISFPQSFSNTHSKWPVIVGFKNLSASVEWTKNISRALWAKTQFSNFPGVVWNARIKRRWITRFSHLVL